MSRRVRVLQVVHRMGRGGVETWLMNVLRNINRERLHFDFLVYTTEPSAYDDEIRALGSHILPCIHPSKGINYLRDLQRILNREGPYDVIHVHGSAAIGGALRAAALAKIPVRVAHSHSTSRGTRRLRSYFYELVTNHWMKNYMTCGLGCSENACAYLFGDQWRSDHRCQVLYYGLDWTDFGKRADVPLVKESLGLPQDALVIGHVGRFEPPKNHDFWLQVASHLVINCENTYFLLVGDGRLRNNIEREVGERGLKDHFVFAGERSDIPCLLQAMDIFLLPSLYEGLGIALVEAQAVGLPCIVSDAVPAAATVIEDQVIRMSLNTPPSIWAKTVVETAARKSERRHLQAWNAVMQSQFSLDYSLEKLSTIYLSENLSEARVQ